MEDVMKTHFCALALIALAFTPLSKKMNKPVHKDQRLFIRAPLKLQNMLSMFGKRLNSQFTEHV
jgi:hypothetical protein